MNGDEKEEAQRPRPLSGGIWTLFSWLRRSERSSSSDSLSSVGSARTAVSFDFLAPGNCDFTNTPIVLTTPLNPPSETYKKRLQDRNLRRQRDRDITLHRKYGLFREFGNGYDGFSLPPTRRALESPENRQNRERRAASESLQRRAAYVPGKRRAPLPPAITISATLPRSYKRKRPAPKPPVISTIKENIDQHRSVRMNSNLKSEEKPTHENELFMSSKIDKCDKKVTNSKDAKSRTDKSFLKHIFENKKRNSAIETPTLRLLPSISELDKQAAEIIENNKLRQNRNNFILDDNFNNSQDSSTLEGNSWFCTSCLRKYNSSVNSCNYCLLENKYPNKNVERDGFQKIFPRSSIYTQTNRNTESASSSQNSMNEQKILKEILKEMKDSLPKKHKDKEKNKVSLITETPTLRIGSTVDESYKDLVSQPSSSSENRHNNVIENYQNNADAKSSKRILSISTLLSETQGNLGTRISNQHAASSAKSFDLSNKNVIQHKVTLAFESHEQKNNVQNTPSKITADSQTFLSNNKLKEKNINVMHSSIVAEDNNDKSTEILLNKIKDENDKQEASIQKMIEDKNNVTTENTHLKHSDLTKSTSKSQSNSSSFTRKGNESKETVSNSQISNEATSLLDRREKFFRDKTYPEFTSNSQKQVLSNTVKTNVPTESVKNKSSPPKMVFLNIPITNAVVVNSVTVVSSQSNDKTYEIPKELFTKNTESQSINVSTSKMPNEAQSSNAELNLRQYVSPSKNVKAISNQSQEQSTASSMKSDITSVIGVKPVSDLHTPLKISTLLNPLYSPRLPIIKEDIKTGSVDKDLDKQLMTNLNAVKSNDKAENKIKFEKLTCRSSDTTSAASKTTHIGKDDVGILQKTGAIVKTRPLNEDIKQKSIENVQEVVPSTSGCSKQSLGIMDSKNHEDKLDHYNRRRHLINQLEQSIAKGDETAAAEAAIKLAKLRLSCSVLSFSSQIVGESSKQNERVSEKILLNQEKKTLSQTEKKIEQIMPQTQKETTEQGGIKANEIIKKVLFGKEFEKNKATKLNTQNEPDVKNPLQENQPSSLTPIVADNIVSIDVWVEDKQAARGPIRLRISRQATIADLRRQAEYSLGLAAQLQRWIIGRTLCTDDTNTVVSLAGPDLKAPFYLCLVQTETKDKAKTEVIGDKEDSTNDNKTNQNGEFYIELMKLEKQSLVPNVEPFECGVCMEECAAGAGVVLRECIHTFCRECLSDVVQHCQEPVVPCPAMGCSGILQEREIRTIVSSEEYERWLARSLATAECGTRNAFHCRTRDCTGWAFCDPGVRRFPCPVCKHTNCVQCQAIHEGETCEQYQAKLRDAVAAAETNKDDEGTQSLINSLISRGEALECPECKAIITKKWGCDWVKCSACKTEICWITKGRRWGPGGRGDTSGGCRCGVDGQRCHPSCGYCH